MLYVQSYWYEEIKSVKYMYVLNYLHWYWYSTVHKDGSATVCKKGRKGNDTRTLVPGRAGSSTATPGTVKSNVL